MRYVATIGMFDGVHLGHQFVLSQVVSKANEFGLAPLCITFDHSPRNEQVLTPLAEKLRLIRQTGIEKIELLAFTPQLKSLTARQFMEQELRDRLGVSVLLTGYDNRFGHNREEGFDDYVRYGRELGIEVLALPAEGNVSSSIIRHHLSEGNVGEAAQLLGHAYHLVGRVIHGEHIGTRLGFPTANIIPEDKCQLIPAPGVYAVRSGELKGMMNIGTRPTFGGHQLTLEVHLFEYDGNLYGKTLDVEFVCRLRAEQHFDSTKSLIEQLKKDAIQARQLL